MVRPQGQLYIHTGFYLHSGTVALEVLGAKFTSHCELESLVFSKV